MVGRLLAAGVLVSAATLASVGSAAADTGGIVIGGQQPTLTGTRVSSPKSSADLARTSDALRRSTSSTRVPVMIKLDFDALASYTGAEPGLAATSPSVTSKPLSTTSAAAKAYLSHIGTEQRTILARVAKQVPSARIGDSFHVVYGGVAATVPAKDVKKLLKIDGVVAVQRDKVNQPQTDSSAAFIKATSLYPQLGGDTTAGKGILLGNLDSGVWPENPEFADTGVLPTYTGPKLACDYGDNPLTAVKDVFRCNNKLVGGRAYLSTYDQENDAEVYGDTARDSDGHGTHTSSTSAGSPVTNAKVMGVTLPRIAGIAPGAQIAEYKVCGATGCYSSDSAAAVEQAILDGVKVINYSVGGGTDPASDPVELAFLDAYNAGVFVSTSAGNDGPSAGTANHLAPWVTSVAASTQAREFDSTMTVTAADGATYKATGSTITAGVPATRMVLASAAPYSDAECLKPAPAGSLTGVVVVCERGTNGRIEKGHNVVAGGAAGMVLYNPQLADTETDNHFLPAIHLADGTALLAFLKAHPGRTTVTWGAGAATKGKGDVMAAFSSRGPAGPFIKPDVTAPGVQIAAGNTPTPDTVDGGLPGQNYQVIAGTSMSSPQVAGAAILLKAAHPTWGPGQIQSALMTQAVQNVVKEDETTRADIYDMGSGRIDVAAASAAPLTISETAAGFAAANLASSDSTSALNLPSVSIPSLAGQQTVNRTITNVTSRTITVTPEVTAPESSTISVWPRQVRVKPGGKATFAITVETRAAEGERLTGEVRLRTAGFATAHLPVAFVSRPGGSITLRQTCDDAKLRVVDSTICRVDIANLGYAPSTVRSTSRTTRGLVVVGTHNSRLVPGAVVAGATLKPLTPGVPAVSPASLPTEDYVDLADVDGSEPFDLGDETLTSFDVPAYTFNGERHTTLTVSSNGYAVAGAAGDADQECCKLPSGASPERPNDIIAPFWTDLDATETDGGYIATASVAGRRWLVVQWDSDIWGTDDERQFQAWIALGGSQDIVFGYASAPTDPGQPFLVGAENALGQGQLDATLPVGPLQITSPGFVPGGSLSYRFRALALWPGQQSVSTVAGSNRQSGKALADTGVVVVRRR